MSLVVLFVWKLAITISRIPAKSAIFAKIPICTPISVVSCSLFPFPTSHWLLKFLIFANTKICFWVIRSRRRHYCTSLLYSPVWFKIAIWFFFKCYWVCSIFFCSSCAAIFPFVLAKYLEIKGWKAHRYYF